MTYKLEKTILNVKEIIYSQTFYGPPNCTTRTQKLLIDHCKIGNKFNTTA